MRAYLWSSLFGKRRLEKSGFGWEDVDWIYFSEDRGQGQDLAKMVMAVQVP
jgi:hypothetical protein